jgi:hypothetical protein
MSARKVVVVGVTAAAVSLAALAGWCGGSVKAFDDPADPDGYRSEVDRLRADVARLDQALQGAAENLTQAEKDRDDNAQNARVASEALSRAQRERGLALQEAAALRQVLASIRRAAEQFVPGSAVES